MTVTKVSETTLAKKLKIRPGSRLLILNAPRNYREKLGALPEGASISEGGDGEFDVVLAYCTKKSDLDQQIGLLKSAMGEKGILWVLYPKGSSKMDTDLNRDILRAHLAGSGLEGVALVSVDETWSAMRFKKIQESPAGQFNV